MWEDPIIQEIRQIREEHAARFNYDLWEIYRDLKEQEEQEKKSGRIFISYPPKKANAFEENARDVARIGVS
jgi:hypothetical protein